MAPARTGPTPTGTSGGCTSRRSSREVTIAAADEQGFEYLNCHPDTGMLRVLLGERLWR